MVVGRNAISYFIFKEEKVNYWKEMRWLLKKVRFEICVRSTFLM